jgi:hypothetical protein
MMNEEFATPAEAYREWVCNAGSDCPERAWILTAWDTWEANPSYVGPAVPHPDDVPEIEEEESSPFNE